MDGSAGERPWWLQLFWSVYHVAPSGKSSLEAVLSRSADSSSWLKPGQESQLIAPAFVVLIVSIIVLRIMAEILWRLL